jgi:intracellular sulfur oxidation DsrE/DsrF family protein
MLGRSSRNMLRTLFFALALIASCSAFAEDKVVFQVTDGDEAKWNMVLNNVRNLQKAADPDAQIEIVAYGPAVALLKSGSPIATRINEAVNAKVKVVACKNTMANMKLTEADMLADVGYVPAGVVEVMRKQQQGYVYIRP